MIQVIAGDLHNRWDKAREMFEEIGLLKLASHPYADERQEGFFLTQLGDAVSLGYGEREANFYRWLYETVGVDKALLGNHELPAVYHHPRQVMFAGYEHRSEVAQDSQAEAVHYPWEFGRDEEATQMVRDKFAAGDYYVAHSVGDWLITHAGLAARYEKQHELKDKPASEVAAYLNQRFEEAMAFGHSDNIIDHTGWEGGGIMWLRFQYLQNGYQKAGAGRKLKQIVGHTGSLGPKLYGDSLWNIDTPAPSKAAGGRADMGGVAALVTEDDGATFKLYYVE